MIITLKLIQGVNLGKMVHVYEEQNDNNQQAIWMSQFISKQ